MDFFILDSEHGGFDYSDISKIIMTSRLAGLKCIVRLADNTRRQLLRVRRFGDIYDQGALALVCKTLVLQILDQPWDVLLSITLTLPELEMNIQVVIVSL